MKCAKDSKNRSRSRLNSHNSKTSITNENKSEHNIKIEEEKKPSDKKILRSPETGASSKNQAKGKSKDTTETLQKSSPQRTFKEPITTDIPNKPKQLKITETLLKFKPRNQNSEIDSLSGKAISVNSKRFKRIDFYKFDINEVDYSLFDRVYFNFKENERKNGKINIIKAILEISLNQNFYGLQGYSNKTIQFWKKIKNQKFFSDFFSCLTAESLKKYWRIISTIKSFDILEEILNMYSDIIESNHQIKILPLIQQIKCSIAQGNDVTNFIEILEKNQRIKIENEHDKLLKEFESCKNKKKKIDDEYESDLQISEGDDDLSNDNLTNENEEDYRTQKISKITINKKFRCLENLIEEFQSIFNYKYDNKFILEALKINSMDIKASFDFLRNPSLNKESTFNEIEDNIILNLKNTKHYNELVNNRGIDLVSQREMFLKND